MENKKILKEKEINGFTVKAVREDCDSIVIGIERNGLTKWVKAVDYDINNKWIDSFMLVFFSVKNMSELF